MVIRLVVALLLVSPSFQRDLSIHAEHPGLIEVVNLDSRSKAHSNVSEPAKKGEARRRRRLLGEPSQKQELHDESTIHSSKLRRRAVVEEDFGRTEQPSKGEFTPRFDFVIGGFPKCGTTTLLKAFELHDQTDIFPSEQCAVASPGQADDVVARKLDETLESLSSDPHTKRSFKCPTAMYNYKSIVRMEKHSPDAKFLVGVRHRFSCLESFYNYRVTEINTRDDLVGESIPTLHEVIESAEPWKGVSMSSTRFELFLMQLGKVVMSPEQFTELMEQPYELAIKPTSFKILIYSVDQLEDENPQREELFRKSVEGFLDLESPLAPFGHENKNHLVGDSGFSETINICEEQFREIRSTLVRQGEKTAAWLKDHFLESEDVTVANKEHFLSGLDEWSRDPCSSELTDQAPRYNFE